MAGAAPAIDRTKYRILLDAPSENPKLGYPEIAAALAEIVMESEPRFAIGIFGKWGSGKTTLMEAVEAGLDPKTCVPVRFVAWRYEREEHLIVPLLDTIREALLAWSESAKTPDDAKEKSREIAGRIGRVMKAIAAGTSVKFGVPGAIDVSFNANKALGVAEKMNEDDELARTPRSFYHASYAALRAAFEQFAGKDGKRRIVVFIDDLDRCLPESALQVLESMKLFFDMPGFVFVVGLDREIVQRVVSSKFRVDDGNAEGGNDARLLGDDYVKKIFQVPYDLAPVAVEQLDEFLQATYNAAKVVDDQRAEFVGVVEKHLPSLVRDGSVNPREVKRYLNAFTITMKIHPELIPDAVLAVLMLDFRPDWVECESALLLNSDAFTLALEEYHKGNANAFEDIGLELRLPPEFETYTRPGAPGNALASLRDVDPYILNVGASRPTRDSELLALLPRVGAIKRELASAGSDQSKLLDALGSAGATMSRVQFAVGVSSGSAARPVENDIARFGSLVASVDKPIRGGAPEDQWRAQVDELAGLAAQIAQQVLALYRQPPGATNVPTAGADFPSESPAVA